MTQPTPEMVERVARALTGHCYVHPGIDDERDCGDLSDMPEVTRGLYMAAARAALAAMPSLDGQAMRETTIRECADYLEGYAGGHYMAKSCAAALRALPLSPEGGDR